jgi:hypothetical protein
MESKSTNLLKCERLVVQSLCCHSLKIVKLKGKVCLFFCDIELQSHEMLHKASECEVFNLVV